MSALIALAMAAGLAAGAGGEPPAPVAPIEGVIGSGARWTALARSSDATLDGLIGSPRGTLLVAQEQASTILEVDADSGAASVLLADTKGAGSLSLDAAGRMFTVQRTCTDPGLRLASPCAVPTAVVQVRPATRLLADKLPDGKGLGRVNDVIGDGRGGAFFTSGGVWHVDGGGVVTVVEDKDIRSNGLMLSLDNKILYVTNETEVLAFDLSADLRASGRRVFGQLDARGGGDGMAVDSDGRLYVTAMSGVHVFTADGRKLGVIAAPRRPIAVGFGGPDRKRLYIIATGAFGPDGREWSTPEGVRNNAKTIYRLDAIAAGPSQRPK